MTVRRLGQQGRCSDRLAAILGPDPPAERMDMVGVASMACGSGAALPARCSEAGA